MNDYDYLLNQYNTANSFRDFNVLAQNGLLPNMNTGMNQSNMNMVNANIQLYTPQEAYEKGNLFSNLYQQYMNYKPAVLRATNERERMFLEFSRMAFAAHELNLYLDNYPDNSSMLRLFHDYSNRASVLMEEYQKKYGPIVVSSGGPNIPFQWVNSTWPWEGEI